jgi:type I restriction enzyme S subunit
LAVEAIALQIGREVAVKNGQEQVRLGDVCGISSTLIDPRGEQYLKMLHVGGANIESLTGGLIDLKSAEEEGLKSGKFLFDEHMVLYSKIRPYLMKVARPSFRGLCSADIYPLLPTEGRLDRDYLFYLLLTPSFTDYAVVGSARAGMPKVNREHLFSFQFSLPSLASQERAVGILNEAFDDIATAKVNSERNYRHASAVLDSYLHVLFTQCNAPQAVISTFGVVFDGPHATPKTVAAGPIFLGISAL